MRKWYTIYNCTESKEKSQNIVEQANSYPNNTSFTNSRRHIICNSSIIAVPNQQLHSHQDTNIMKSKKVNKTNRKVTDRSSASNLEAFSY